jgi:kinesin family protein 5
MEGARNASNSVKLSDTAVDIQVDDQPYAFQFDRVFGPSSSQKDVFENTATPLIHDVLQGYNATIFAYGQTGAGKTHTMEGNINVDVQRGIIPRSVEALFDAVCEADESLEFTFKVTYVEIYMEKIRDLLDETRLKVNLTIREDKVKGIYIADVTEEYVTSQEELLEIMAAGALNRATAATGMNEGSSRSHSVFTLTVNQKDTRSGVMKSGKLVLVDLAGSEMVRKSNASGQQLEEAKTINKSLSALGGVINALTDDKQTHIPYRDSKLTRILQDSLGGNSKTVLIIAISPSSYNAPESLSTLRFGMRAKSIENKVTVNQTRSPEELEALLVRAEKAIDAQDAQIQALQAEVQALKEGAGREDGGSNGGLAAAADAARAEAQQKIISQMEEAMAQLTQELEEERAEGARKDAEGAALVQRVKEKEKLLQEAGELLREAQKHYETQRTKAEQLLREKAALEGDFQAQRDQLQAELDKARFDMQELEVTAETLRTENQQMAQEIAEISGDAVERPRAAKKGAGSGGADGGGRYQAIGGADAFDGAPTSSSSAAAAAAAVAASSSVVGEAERAARFEKDRQELLDAVAENGVKADGPAGRVIAQWLDASHSQAEALARAFEARLAHVERIHGDQVSASCPSFELMGRIQAMCCLFVTTFHLHPRPPSVLPSLLSSPL